MGVFKWCFQVGHTVYEMYYDIVLCGDFNLSKVRWLENSLDSTPEGRITEQVNCISDCVVFYKS